MSSVARYFAKINNGIVEQVVVAASAKWCADNLGGVWKETFIDRKDYAGKGYAYHSALNKFSFPQPFPSWTLDANKEWQSPKTKPAGDNHVWNETSQKWVAWDAIVKEIV